MALALLSGLLVFGAAPVPAAAEPGNPGQPGEPTVLYEEDFENTDDGANTLLGDYTGSDGTAYEADAFWQSRTLCNGFIIDRTSPRVVGDCNGVNNPESTGIAIYQSLTALVDALGRHAGAADPSLNAAAASFTSGDGANNLVQFRTADPLSLDADNRFVTFSVDAVAMNCFATHPKLRFYLDDGDGEQAMSGAAIDPCTDARATAINGTAQEGTTRSTRAGTFPGDSAVLLSGGEFDIVLRNENGSGRGNDGAYDNIRVLDVTPQLDKSFGPETALVDGTSTLTFTVTNTSELGAKNGWSFTDNLPEGLVAAEPAKIGGTCTATTTVGDDGSTIAVANGQLAAGAESCTITVDVTSGTAGEYENCADDISDPVGIDLPGCATVTFETQEDFQCSPQGILFQYPNGAPTRVIGIDIVTGAATTLGNLQGREVNAIAYNGLDDYVYGLDLLNNTIVRVGSDMSTVAIGWPEGLQPAVIGDIDDEGRYWIAAGLDWFVVDMVPGSDSYGTVVDQGSAPVPTGVGTGADWAYVPGTDALWSIGTRAGQSVLIKFDRASGERTIAADLGVLGGNTFGAVYADPNGFLYGSDNVTGQIFRVDVAAGTAQRFSGGPSSGTNDGARCATAPIPVDFGDAPDSYGTTLAEDGPRHSIPGIDVEADTAPLMLGSKIDIDADGVPSEAADADDTAGVADEDGVTQPLQLAQTGPTTVSVTATNNRNQAATLAGWIDLDGNGTFDAAELVTATVPAGSGTTAYPLEFGEFTGEGTTYARFRLFGASELAAPSPTGAAGAGEVEDYVVYDRDLSIEKTSDATAATRIGDTVTYTVTVTNTGTAPFTDEDPAIVTDDLTGLLDDATYNDDADASAGEVTFDEPRLTWTGALEPDASVTITYSVKLTGAGDTVISNVAFQPNCDPAEEDCEPVTPPVEECAEGGLDPETGLPCDATTLELPKLSIKKTADSTAIPEVGQTVTYTVTAINDGTGAFTADDPAVVVDDLSGVLDDATVDPASLTADRDPAAQYAEPQITWSGALAPGETVTITYQVTYTGAGDHKLVNVAFAPADPENPEPPTCDPADENGLDPETGQPCARNQIPAAGLNVTKSVDPADGDAVKAGQEVTYTITFNNDGEADAAVTAWKDDLSDVLDDAELITGPTASDEALTLSELADGRFTVDGTVAVGETITVTYTVRVLPDGERGNNQLGNVVGQNPPPPGTPCAENDPLCTSNPIPEVVDSKSVDPESGTAVKPGQQIDYTLTFHNDGTAAGTVNRVDDLNHVLDDAEVTTLPTSSDPALAVSGIENGRFSVTGDLQPGQTVTVTYTATVRGLDDLGDGTLANFILDPEQPTPKEPICEGDDCTANPITRLSVTKSADPSSGATVEEGQRITYTLTFRNEGSGEAAVDHTDHLAGVLDDAEVITSAEASDSALTVLDADDQYTVQGTLAAGQTVTVSYVVEVLGADDQGDGVLANFVTETGADAPETCAEDDPTCTSHPVEGSEPTLPDTGAPNVLIALIGGLALLAAGGVVIGRRFRKGGGDQES